jgi:hypothetical protein
MKTLWIDLEELLARSLFKRNLISDSSTLDTLCAYENLSISINLK